MQPAAFKRQAEQAALFRRSEKCRREAERPCRAVLEQRRFDDSHAGIDVRRGFARRRTAQPSLRVAKEIAASFDPDAGLHVGKQQQHIHFRAVPGARQPCDLWLPIVDPQGVGIADEKRFSCKFMQHLDDAAALVEQQLPLIRNFYARRSAALHVVLDLVGQPMHVDDGLVDARFREPVEHVIEHGPSTDAHQRFWQGQGDRPHPRAKPGGEDECFFRPGAHADTPSCKLSILLLQGRMVLVLNVVSVQTHWRMPRLVSSNMK